MSDWMWPLTSLRNGQRGNNITKCSSITVSCDYLTASSTSFLSTRSEALDGDVTTNRKDTRGVSSHTMMFDTLVKIHRTIKTTSVSQHLHKPWVTRLITVQNRLYCSFIVIVPVLQYVDRTKYSWTLCCFFFLNQTTKKNTKMFSYLNSWPLKWFLMAKARVARKRNISFSFQSYCNNNTPWTVQG